MASGRVLSHLLRSTSLRLLKPAVSSPRSPFPAGFLLSRAVQYATSAVPPTKAPASPSAGPSGKITDEFTGAGAIGRVCLVDGTEGLARGQMVRSIGSPITVPISTLEEKNGDTYIGSDDGSDGDDRDTFCYHSINSPSEDDDLYECIWETYSDDSSDGDD